MEELHQPGDIIAERYRIIETLGQGGNGITYKAEDLKSTEQVALKALSLHHMSDWKQMELFEREAQTLASLNHPGIPKYLDYFQVDTPEDRGFYIVQQLVVGKSLAELVKNGWRTNEAGVRKIATQVLNILIYLQKLKPPVFHRDIKPQNLIGAKDGKVYLVDFGSVQNTYRSTFSYGSTVVGTFGYMAPEQFQGQALPATDLYGLGATLLFLLTHRSPADLPTDRLKISFRKRVQISEQFADWLEKMLEPDAEDRFVSAKVALEALGRSKVVFSKARQSIPRKAAIAMGLVAITSLICLKFFRYPAQNLVLSVLGYPSPILGNISNAVFEGDIDNMRGYLWLGGRISDLWGCNVKSERVAKFLISQNSNINSIRDDLGNTPLHSTVSRYQESHKIVELLLANNANVSAMNRDGKTPLHLAVTPVYWDENDTATRRIMINILIAQGADVNAKDNDGKTPLHLAVPPEYSSENHIARSKIMIGFLITKGADVNTKDNDRNTPLHLTQKKEIAELLIAKGADINANNYRGNSPLNMAINEWNVESYSPTKQKMDETIELLILKGANVNITIYKEKDYDNREEDTPLHRAIKLGKNHLSELLVSRGANINAKNNSGVTPLDIARTSGNRAMSVLLRSRGGKDSGLCRVTQIFDPGSNSTEKYNTVDLNCGYGYNHVRVRVPR
jgi:ankyrin repeat protein